jgi:phage shock protein A
LKDIAARELGKVLASDATMKVLTSPQLKTMVVKAINLRAEARDAVEKRVKDVAKALELVTRDDVARLKRSIRDLEDHMDDLRGQVAEAQADLASAKVQAAQVENPAKPAVLATATPIDAPAKKPRKAKAVG